MPPAWVAATVPYVLVSGFFFLSGTGQACLTQVEMPSFGNSQVCTKTHTAKINSNIKISFIFLSFLSCAKTTS